MIGCGLPCVVPVVSAAEVVRVGADRILANRRARSFWLMEVERGCCRESHPHAWCFPRFCRGRAKVCRVLLPRTPLSWVSFLPLRLWKVPRDSLGMDTGSERGLLGVWSSRCSGRCRGVWVQGSSLRSWEVQSSLQILRRNPKFCAL